MCDPPLLALDPILAVSALTARASARSLLLGTIGRVVEAAVAALGVHEGKKHLHVRLRDLYARGSVARLNENGNRPIRAARDGHFRLEPSRELSLDGFCPLSTGTECLLTEDIFFGVEAKRLHRIILIISGAKPLKEFKKEVSAQSHHRLEHCTRRQWPALDTLSAQELDQGLVVLKEADKLFAIDNTQPLEDHWCREVAATQDDLVGQDAKSH
jgi:hypothetical protein